MNKITSKADLDAAFEAAKGKLALRLVAHGEIDSKKKDILCCGWVIWRKPSHCMKTMRRRAA